MYNENDNRPDVLRVFDRQHVTHALKETLGWQERDYSLKSKLNSNDVSLLTARRLFQRAEIPCLVYKPQIQLKTLLRLLEKNSLLINNADDLSRLKEDECRQKCAGYYLLDLYMWENGLAGIGPSWYDQQERIDSQGYVRADCSLLLIAMISACFYGDIPQEVLTKRHWGNEHFLCYKLILSFQLPVKTHDPSVLPIVTIECQPPRTRLLTSHPVGTCLAAPFGGKV